MRRQPARLLIVALLLASAAPLGCNARGPRSPDVPELGYFSARGYDFVDMFEFNLGAGPGLFAAAEVTPIRAALGWTDTSRIGFMGRAGGTWEEYRAEIIEILHWHKKPCYGNGYLFTEETIHRTNFLTGIDVRESHDTRPILSNTKRMPFYEEWGWTTRYQDWERPWMDVDVEATIIFFSVDVAVSPQEIGDFLLGIFGVDAISHDDKIAVPIDAVPTADEPEEVVEVATVEEVEGVDEVTVEDSEQLDDQEDSEQP